MAYPYLSAWNPATQNIERLRTLKRDELRAHKEFTKICKDAENRLRLFRILAMNYEEWAAFVNKCLSATHQGKDNMLKLEQLMLNFLSSAYALTEHFNVTFARKYRRDPKKKNCHRDFIEKLCDAEWAFAFFQDFRNFAQHQGLPIGHFSRNVSYKSVRLTVEYDAKDLLENSRRKSDWGRSKLTEGHGKIDLIKHLRSYYVRLRQDYGKFIATDLYPDLEPADKFYQTLLEEVHSKFPEHRMIFSTYRTPAPNEFKITGTEVPNDVFGELGIIRIRRA